MNDDADASVRSHPLWQRLAIFAVIAVLMAVFILNRDAISLDSLVHQQYSLRKSAADQPGLILGSAFILYVLVTGLSLPGAALMSIVFGWLFGLWRAIVLVSFASTTGATIAFLLSRFLFRDAIQARFADRLTSFNEALARDGAYYLFMLRLMPQVPFFVVNLVMGLTPIRTSTFWWVSQLGMLPGTCVFAYAGASIHNMESLRDKGVSGILTWQLVSAFALLGFFPLIVRRLISLFSKLRAR